MEPSIRSCGAAKNTLEMTAPAIAPTIGATINIHTWLIAQPRWKIAVASERAGFSDVLVTGIEIRCILVSARPMAIGAKPLGARSSVEPRITSRKNAVHTASIMKHAASE